MKRNKTQQQPTPTGSSRPSLVAIIVDCGIADVSTHTLAALLRLTDTSNQSPVKYRFMSPTSDDRALNLNTALTKIFNERAITHFMIVDADTGFDPLDVATLVQDDKPLSALSLPLTHLGLDHLHYRIVYEASHPDEDRLPPLHRAREADTAQARLLLGKREVLERMVKTECAAKLSMQPLDNNSAVHSGLTEYFGFVSPIREDGTHRQLAQKAAFLYRWRHACDGQIWTRADMAIEVIGRYELKMKFNALKVA